MNVADLWSALAEDATKATNQVWLLRTALPLPGCDLKAGFHVPSRTPAVLLELKPKTELSPRHLPACAGLELRVTPLSNRNHLEVRLRDPACMDVFTVLVQDVVHRIAQASGPRSALEELLGRLSRWQHFLQVSREGLSIDAQRGLWGELHVLANHLVPAIGSSTSTEGWKASSGAHQDFQFATGAIEVKTTIAKQPQSVRITSERQLDEAGVGLLLLWVVVLDEREVPAAEEIEGVTLPMKVAATRAAVASDAGASRALELGLFERGWMDAHEHRYRDRRWAVRREEVFEVKGDFPRITEAMLPGGAGSVTYALSLSACESFLLDPAIVRTKLGALKGEMVR